MITLASGLRMGGGSGGGGGGGTSGVEFVGATSVSGDGDLYLTGITGLQDGDLVVFAAMDDSRNFRITSSGWTSMTNANYSNSIDFVIEYKVMGSTVDTRVFLDETVDALCAIAFRGAADASYSDSYSGSTSASFSLPTFTIAENNSAALVIAFLDDDDSTISTIPAGYTVATTSGRSGGSAAIMFKLVDAGNSIVSGSWSSYDNNITIGYDISPA